MRYDAFISYRHGGLDGQVAEKLHKLLETYRIPAAVARQTGKKRIRRVFRDREELPTSSNLSGSINDALENSEYLLLICSPRLLESKWCMREVEIFGKLHGKDRIISLLIQGEPDEAFPPDIRVREIGGQIIEVEPLAADIRAPTHRESLKRLKSEKLRLLAPILGCAYDDLRQRHRARRRKVLATLISAALAVSLSFGAFSTFQYLQIQRQMQLKLENQSHVLAGYSAEALANGYPEIATLLALEALPRSLERPERPYVGAARRALADALGVYDLTGGFKPHKTVTLPAAPGDLALSPGGRYGAACYAFEVVVFDLETGHTVATLPTVQSVLAGAVFLSDTVLAYAGEAGLTAYDIPGARALWTGAPATGLALSGDRATLAAIYKDAGRALLYTAEGAPAGEIDFAGRACPVPADDTFLNPRDFILALNADGTSLAVSFEGGGLSVFDTASGRETPVYPATGAIHLAGGFSGDCLAFAAVEQAPFAAQYRVFDLAAGAFILSLTSEAARFVPGQGEGGIFFAHENQIYQVDSAGGMNHVASVAESIETLAVADGLLLACDSAGGYQIFGEGAAAHASQYVCDLALLGGGFALTGSYDSDTVRILKRQASAAPSLFAYDRGYAFSEARVDVEAGLALLYSYRGFRLHRLDGTTVAEVQFPSPDGVVDTQFHRAGGNLAVLYENALRLYSARDGALLLEITGKAVTFSPFGVHVLQEDGRLLRVDLEGAGVADGGSVPAQADFAVLAGAPLYGVDGTAYYNGQALGAGSFLGGADLGEGRYALALADGERGTVFTVGPQGVSTAFDFQVRGKAQAFFVGDVVLIAQLRGTATAYRMDGTVLRTLTEDGYVAEAQALGDGVLVHLISASAGRYALLLDGPSLEAGACLPGLLDAGGADMLIFDDRAGHLRMGRVYEAGELMEAARAALNGRTLTQEERTAYRAQ